MQTQTKRCLCFSKININFFSNVPKLPLIPQVGPSPNIKKSFLRLSVSDDKLLSPPSIIISLAVLLKKLHSLFPSNANS